MRKTWKGIRLGLNILNLGSSMEIPCYTVRCVGENSVVPCAPTVWFSSRILGMTE